MISPFLSEKELSLLKKIHQLINNLKKSSMNDKVLIQKSFSLNYLFNNNIN